MKNENKSNIIEIEVVARQISIVSKMGTNDKVRGCELEDMKLLQVLTLKSDC